MSEPKISDAILDQPLTRRDLFEFLDRLRNGPPPKGAPGSPSYHKLGETNLTEAQNILKTMFEARVPPPAPEPERDEPGGTVKGDSLDPVPDLHQ